MRVRIPENTLEGISKWMTRGPWPDHYQEAINDHIGAYCEHHDIDSSEELANKIGMHWYMVLDDMVMKDFLGRETEDGNIVTLYLKRRGWKEKKIVKAYLEGIRDSVVSLYEVSDIRPGESFLARDLILGGDPIRVSERLGTKTMAPWDRYAMRLIELRGHHIVAGDILPFKQHLADEVIDDIRYLMTETKALADETLSGSDADPGDGVALEDLPPEALRMLAAYGTLKNTSPLIAETWMMGTVLDPADAVLPKVFNTDGDEIEFIKVTCRLAKGATQANVRAILDGEPDMAPASAKVWNWIVHGRSPGRLRSKALPTGGQFHKTYLEDGSLVLGMIALKGRVLEADTNSTHRAEELKSRIADLLGDLVEPPTTMRKTLEQVMADRRESGQTPDRLELPPEEAARFRTEFLDLHYRDTLDEPVGMLNGQAPREAIATPEGREQVATWLKYLERREAKTCRDGPFPPYDFSWMWNELGIPELRK